MLHRLFLRVAVAHDHHCAIVGIQSLGQSRGFAVRRNDLAGVRMVGGDDHQGIAVFSRKLQRLLHRFVEVYGFADLATRIRRMILFIDGSAFHLQEETFLVAAQQVNRFLRHLRQRRHRGVAFRVWRTGHRRLIDIAVIRRLRPFPANRHIAIGEETQQRLSLTGVSRGGKGSRVGHNLVAARFRLLAQGFALPLARRRRFGKGLRPAA